MGSHRREATQSTMRVGVGAARAAQQPEARTACLTLHFVYVYELVPLI